MSILGQVTMSGGNNTGIRMVVAALEKMGKTTLISNSPRPLLIPLEQGYSGIQMHHVPLITDWDTLVKLQHEIVTAITKKQFQYMTIGVDSLTALERLAHTKILEDERAPMRAKGAKQAALDLVSMETAQGGYGKAYAVARTMIQNFLVWCDYLATTCGIHVIMTCHVFSDKFQNPEVGEYNVWDLRLHAPKNGKNFGVREQITEWADIIGYLHEEVFVARDKDSKTAVASSSGRGRILSCHRTPMFVAGNRFGIQQDLIIPAPPANGWNTFAAALYAASGRDVWNRDKL